jgi:type IV pilus assembly protein PilY1
MEFIMKYKSPLYLVFGLMATFSSYADDTEIFTGGGAAGTQNILMIMDTSRSMSAWADTSVKPYSSSEVYESYGFDKDSLYLISAAYQLDSLDSSDINNIRSNEILAESINCSTSANITTSLSEEGISIANYAFFQPGEGWETSTVSTGAGTITQCKESPYNYQGNLYNYLANTTKFEQDSSIYTNQDDEFICTGSIFGFCYKGYTIDYSFDWNNNVYSKIVTGNYLNYQGWDGKEPQELMRIDAVKQAAKEVVGSLSSPNIRVGLMRFNSDHSPYKYGTQTGEGGYLDLPLTSVSELGNLFDSKIDSYDAIGGTPLEQTLYEAYSYFSGGPVTYGEKAYYAKWERPIDKNWRNESDTNNPGILNMNTSSQADDYYSNVEFYTTSSSATDAGNYIKPDFNGCKPSNKIVYFSDGDASNFDNAKENIEDISNSIDCGNSSGYGACLKPLANYMSNESELDITINTIGGFVSANDTATTTLRELATAGQGSFYPADNYSELVDAFTDAILGDLLEEPATFTSPAIAVSSYNSLKASNDLYYAVFEPKSNGSWIGNLKRYQLGKDGVEDAYGNKAVNSETGFFNTNSTSIWSSVQDGADVSKGGAAGRLGDIQNRSIYGLLNNGLQKLSEAKILALTNNLLGLDLLDGETILDLPLLGVSTEQRLAKWIMGKNADDTPRLSIEDPLHSRPIVFNYEGGKRLVFIGTNSGYLHAFDADTGKEEYAVIPQEVLKNPLYYVDPGNFQSPDKIYGLDGAITYYHDDKDLDSRIDDGETAYLYVGMRRGGHSYYAFNISDSSKPEFLWKKHGNYVDQPIRNTPDVSPGFERLGQTWSSLKPALVKGEGVVLLTAGGYDPDEDGTTISGPSTRINHDIGNTIYMLNPKTGEVIWDAYSDIPGVSSSMTSGFASDVSPVDTDKDGYIDILYAADLGGRIWRFDFNDSGITGGVIADLNSGTESGNRRFFSSPDVSSLDNKLIISIGSGYRAHPLTTSVDDQFYLIIDPHQDKAPEDGNYITLTPSDLTKWSTSNIDDIDDIDLSSDSPINGWYIPLSLDGEKVINSSITFKGIVTFNTFAPSSNMDLSQCSGNLGVSRSYSLAPTKDAAELCGENCNKPGEELDVVIETPRPPGQPIIREPPPPEEEECDPTVQECYIPSCEDTEMIIISGTTSSSANVDRCKLFEKDFWEEEL